ncbi:MAG: hypothetical protein COW02_04955 [Comamonadaceae bacterium CG12_big_fil_rev_8_21_14_0_65_59_15]|nr:MAG: hypothetical protein COW02_04955 [Comamonadaceae bacterium CG12_big_fil_rev_8_21_14_0_65_59_15]PIY01649.1 MAG: hypothetical protein COZ23_02020 [Hydrogenophilales bacterium CG_4_10_14_3_um_filter_58_23]PJB07162.1 MAG: hypothetical protein CO125_05430 [Hydrogenophilales bacterium CG_4_9_14_3_um_filter_59_35]
MTDTDTHTQTHSAESGLLERAQVLFNLERYRDALEMLRPHIYADDDPVSAFELCSACMRLLGDYSAARKLAEEALSHYPQESVLHIELARTLCGQSLFQAALEEARQAVALWPCADTHALESAVLYDMSRYDDSVLCIRRALDMEPNNPTWHSLLAKNLYYQDKEEESLTSVNTGLSLDPNHVELLGMLARLEHHRGKKLDLLRSVLHLDPQHKAHRNLYNEQTQQFRRTLLLAAAFTLLHLAVKFLMPADLQWAYKSSGAIVIWIVGVALATYEKKIFRLIVGFNFVNIALGIAPNDFAAAWVGLTKQGAGIFLAMSVGLVIMAYIGTLIMMIVKVILIVPWASIREVWQAFREARKSGVTKAFLHELIHSRNTWFNLAACLPPLFAPLLASSWNQLVVYLLFVQPLLLYILGRLWLPEKQRVGYWGLLFLHGFVLMFLSAGHDPAVLSLSGNLLLGLALALTGIITADFLRRIA